MADRPEMFRPTRGFSGMADSMEPTMQNVRPTLVAMATTFGLGVESRRLPACIILHHIISHYKLHHIKDTDESDSNAQRPTCQTCESVVHYKIILFVYCD